MSNKYLIFDVETTGLPIEWEASVYDVDNWPRVVQIAWQLYDDDKKLLKEYNFIIKPDGYVIPNQASHIHNITTAKAIEVGEDIGLVLKLFINSVNQAGLLIAHNYKFDSNVIGAELIRKGHLNVFDEKNYTCTMLETIHLCKAEGKIGYKYPRLEELYFKLFQENFDAHNALNDVKATARCFWELYECFIDGGYYGTIRDKKCLWVYHKEKLQITGKKHRGVIKKDRVEDKEINSSHGIQKGGFKNHEIYESELEFYIDGVKSQYIVRCEVKFIERIKKRIIAHRAVFDEETGEELSTEEINKRHFKNPVELRYDLVKFKLINRYGDEVDSDVINNFLLSNIDKMGLFQDRKDNKWTYFNPPVKPFLSEEPYNYNNVLNIRIFEGILISKYNVKGCVKSSAEEVYGEKKTDVDDNLSGIDRVIVPAGYLRNFIGYNLKEKFETEIEFIINGLYVKYLIKYKRDILAETPKYYSEENIKIYFEEFRIFNLQGIELEDYELNNFLENNFRKQNLFSHEPSSDWEFYFDKIRQNLI